MEITGPPEIRDVAAQINPHLERPPAVDAFECFLTTLFLRRYVILRVFGLLLVYQLYRFAHTHSITLAVLIVLDTAVCYLIWREWTFRREAVAAEGVVRAP